MKERRILVYSPSFSPSIGGMEKSTSLLCEGLKSLCGAHITIITDTRSDSDGEKDIFRRPSFSIILKLVKNSDIILSNGFRLALFVAAKLNQSPIIWDHHDYDTICPKGIAWSGRPCGFNMAGCFTCMLGDWSFVRTSYMVCSLMLKKIFSNLVSANVVHSEFVNERLKLRHSRVIPRGVKTIKEPAGRERRNDILFVGRLIPEKGCDILLRALKEMKEENFKLSICGRGPEKARLEELTSELGLDDKVEFCGPVSDSVLHEKYRGSKVVVVPSVLEEPFGLVAIEALSAGCVVLASDRGGLAQIKGAIRFKGEDAPDLANKLRGVLSDKETFEKISHEGKSAVSRYYGMERYIKDYSDLIESLFCKEKKPEKIIIISPARADIGCGIGDYVHNFSKELSKKIDVEIALSPYPIFGRKKERPYLLVQYEPILYGAKGFNIFFPIFLLLLRFKGYTIISMVHEAYPLLRWNAAVIITGLFRRLMAMIMITASNKIIVSSSWLEDQFRRVFKQRRKDIKCIAAGSNIPCANATEEEMASARKRVGISSNDFVLAQFGAMGIHQDISFIVDAFEKMREINGNTRLLFIGKKRSDIEKYFLRKKGSFERVICTGFLPKEDVSKLFSISDVILLPFTDGVSTRRTAFMAALGHGKAVVTTRGPSTDMSIFKKAPVLMSACADRNGYISEVLSLAGDGRKRAEFGEKARDFFDRNFSWEKIANEVFDFLTA